jgi:hypothetical protein
VAGTPATCEDAAVADGVGAAAAAFVLGVETSLSMSPSAGYVADGALAMVALDVTGIATDGATGAADAANVDEPGVVVAPTGADLAAMADPAAARLLDDGGADGVTPAIATA